MSEETFDPETLVPILQEALGQNYSNLRFVRRGGTRAIYEGQWGPHGERKVALKVDLPQSGIQNPRARRHTQRGCTSANDARMALLLERGESEGLLPLVDYADLSPMYEGAVHVEPWFESETLEERVSSTGALAHTAWADTFSQVLHTAADYGGKGVVHRDPKPSNILLGKNEQAGKVRITDFANGATVDAVTDKVDPTLGSIQVTDPRHYALFNGGIPSRYGFASEVFAYGMGMIYAATGRLPVSIDPDAGTAVRTDTHESILDDQGKIDSKKFRTAINDAFASWYALPWKDAWKLSAWKAHPLAKYVSVMKRAVDPDLSKRYGTLEELCTAFEKKRDGGIFGKVKRNWKAAAASFLIGAAALGTAAGLMVQRNADETMAHALEDANKYEVHAEWNGADGVELVNNLVDLHVNAFNHKPGNKNSLYRTKGVLFADAGDDIDFSINLKESHASREISAPRLDGRLYLEGYPVEVDVYNHDLRENKRQTVDFVDFSAHPLPLDETDLYGDMMGILGATPRIFLPKGLSDGNYTLAVEVYEAEPIIESNLVRSPREKAIKFSKPGRALARKRIPLIVGNPSKAADVAYIKMGAFGETISFRDLSELQEYGYICPKGVKYRIAIPEERFEFSGQGNFGGMGLPSCKDSKAALGESRTMEVITIDENTGRPISYTAFPIKKAQWGSGDYIREEWVFDEPTREFGMNLKSFRERAYKSLENKGH